MSERLVNERIGYYTHQRILVKPLLPHIDRKMSDLSCNWGEHGDNPDITALYTKKTSHPARGLNNKTDRMCRQSPKKIKTPRDRDVFICAFFSTYHPLNEHVRGELPHRHCREMESRVLREHLLFLLCLLKRGRL